MEYKFGGEIDEIEIDKYMKAILDYIEDHDGCNESDVRMGLADAGICSELTTRRKIRHLLELGLIEDRKIRNNGFHRLYLSDRTEINKIKELAGNIVGSAYLLETSDNNIVGSPLSSEILNSPFSAAYNETIDFIFSLLLYRTNNGTLSKRDSQYLSKHIVGLALALKVNSFRGNEFLKTKILQIMSKNLENLQILSKRYKGDVERYKRVKAVLDHLAKLTERLLDGWIVGVEESKNNPHINLNLSTLLGGPFE